MTEYLETATTSLSQSSLLSSEKELKRTFNSSVGLNLSIVKSISRRIISTIGIDISIARKFGFARGLDTLLSLASSVAKSMSYRRGKSTELGIVLTSDATYSEGGIPVGTKLYYSSIWGSPELWAKEPNRCKIKYSDIIAGRARLAEIILSNPGNSRDEIYSTFRRIKLVDYLTGQIIFLGRVNVANSSWDNTLGQILSIKAYDYMYELIKRYCTGDYSGSAFTRAELVEEILEDNTTSGTISWIVSKDGSTGTVRKDYTRSTKKISQVIEELAIEDSVDESASGCDYRVDDSYNPVFEYFVRGTKPVGGTSDGLTISLTDTVGDQVKRMLPDYNFSTSPVEIVTHVIVRGEDSDGNKLEGTATSDTLESTYNLRTEYIDTVYGATTQAYLNNRATELLKLFGSEIKRGKCSIIGFPTYKIDDIYYFVRAGDLVHIHNTLQSINQDYLVISAIFEEPPTVTKFELLDISKYGRDLPAWIPKQPISASDIGDLKLQGLGNRAIVFPVGGGLSAEANATLAIPVPYTFTVTEVYLYAKTAPTGADIIVDVNLDGVTIFTTQDNRPTIADGENTGSSSTIDVVSLSQDQLLTVDIDQVGSTIAGSDLTIEVRGIQVSE